MVSGADWCGLSGVVWYPQPQEDVLNDDEIVKIASLFVKQGVNKIRLTGGEPLVHGEIVQLVQRLNALEGYVRPPRRLHPPPPTRSCSRNHSSRAHGAIPLSCTCCLKRAPLLLIPTFIFGSSTPPSIAATG